MTEKKYRGKALLIKINELIDKRKFRLSKHFEQRQAERDVFLWEVLSALRNGNHCEDKDEWDNKHQVWKYAIQGRTLEARELFVVATIIEDIQLLFITVYEVARRKNS